MKKPGTASNVAAIMQGIPTPCVNTLRRVFDSDAPESTPEEMQDTTVDSECECPVGLFSAEQTWAHKELIICLAEQLSEFRESDTHSETTSPCREVVQRLAVGFVFFVIALITIAPLVLLFSCAPSSALVSPSAALQQTEVLSRVVERTFLPGDINGIVTAISAIPASPISLSRVEETLLPSAQKQTAPAHSASAGSNLSNASLNASASANASDAIQQMWSRGRFFLQHSRCNEAESLFAQALSFVDEQIATATSANALLLVDRNALKQDQAFAMICMLRFEKGAQLLEQVGLNASSMHMNALGYARFKLKDFRKAGAAFELGLRVDPFNKIMWSNLAAAKLLTGDIRAADDAMYNALDPENNYFQADPWFDKVFIQNVNAIAQHAIGKKAHRPSIEMWYAAN